MAGYVLQTLAPVAQTAFETVLDFASQGYTRLLQEALLRDELNKPGPKGLTPLQHLAINGLKELAGQNGLLYYPASVQDAMLTLARAGATVDRNDPAMHFLYRHNPDLRDALLETASQTRLTRGFSRAG